MWLGVRLRLRLREALKELMMNSPYLAERLHLPAPASLPVWIEGVVAMLVAPALAGAARTGYRDFWELVDSARQKPTQYQELRRGKTHTCSDYSYRWRRTLLLAGGWAVAVAERAVIHSMSRIGPGPQVTGRRVAVVATSSLKKGVSVYGCLEGWIARGCS